MKKVFFILKMNVDNYLEIAKYLDFKEIYLVTKINKEILLTSNVIYKALIKIHHNMIYNGLDAENFYYKICLEKLDILEDNIYKLSKIFVQISCNNIYSIRSKLNNLTHLIINITIANICPREYKYIYLDDIKATLNLLSLNKFNKYIFVYDFSSQIEQVSWKRKYLISKNSLILINIILSYNILEYL